MCGAGFMHWVMHLAVRSWGYALGYILAVRGWVYAFRCAGLGLCLFIVNLLQGLTILGLPCEYRTL